MTTRDLVQALIQGDSMGIEKEFNQAMAERINDVLDDYRVQVAQETFGESIVQEALEPKTREHFVHHASNWADHKLAAYDANDGETEEHHEMKAAKHMAEIKKHYGNRVAKLVKDNVASSDDDVGPLWNHHVRHMVEELDLEEEAPNPDKKAVVPGYGTTADKGTQSDQAKVERTPKKHHGKPTPGQAGAPHKMVHAEEVEQVDEDNLQEMDPGMAVLLGVASSATGSLAARYAADKLSKWRKKREAEKFHKQNIAKIKQKQANEEVEKVDEVLTKDQPASAWIHDFVKSKDPRFKGASKKDRIKRALAAYYAKQRGE